MVKIFYPKADKHVKVVSSDDIQEVKLNVSGMTCNGCEEHVKHEIDELPGIVSTSADYRTGNTLVKFDKTKTNKDAIINAINATGYKVTNIWELQ